MLAVAPYYEPEGGGLERYAHAILRRLAARGHAMRALAFTRGAPSEALQDGVEVARLSPRFRVSNTPVDPGFRARVVQEIGAWEPDVVLAHTPVPFPAEMASLAARRAGVPFVLTYHAGRLEGGSPLLDAVAALDRATLERGMLGSAARLIAVSPFVRDKPLGAHRARVTVIPPGVDARVFRPSDEAPAQEVLFVGPLDRAYRWKGVDVLWVAFKMLRQRLPEARLVLVGDGDRRAEFQARVRAEGLEGAVEMPGRLPLEGLVRAYQRCGVAALPSVSEAESFGMVLAEANACGRPVVGARVGGIPDFVRHGDNGLLAEPGDPAALAEALATLLREPALGAELGARGRARVLAEHGWDHLAARTEAVLEQARKPLLAA